MDRVAHARQLFTDRYSCSQAVFVAYAPTYGVGPSLALRLSSAMGGGIRAGGTCGAVLGALMVLGLAGCDDECTPESRHDVMSLVDAFHERFEARIGSLDCPGVLGYDIRIPEQKAVYLELGLRESRCLEAVTVASEILEDLLPAT